MMAPDDKTPPAPAAPDEHVLDMSDSTVDRLLEAGLKSTRQAVTWTPPSCADLQAVLPDYEVIALIGQGGMGAVYRGVQRSLDRAVAIKVLPPEIAASDEQYAIRFQQEARAMARLSHPNIVPVHDYGETRDGLLHFVMGFVDGTDLQRVIRSEGQLSPRRAAAIITQVCAALEFAHERGIVHRDIKPSNIMLDRTGQVKVADFGLAKELDTTLADAMTMSRVVMGTRAYMAPEQAMGKEVDHRADLYSLGATFYEMLTGEPPHGAIEPPSLRVPVDVKMDRIVLKALARDPVRRYQRASEIDRDVREVPDTEAGLLPAAPVPEPARTQFPVLKTVLAVLALILIATLVRLVWQERSQTGQMPPGHTMSQARRAQWDQEVRDYAALFARHRADPSVPLPPATVDTHRLIAERMLNAGGWPTLKLPDGTLTARLPGQTLPEGEWQVTLLGFPSSLYNVAAPLTRDELLFMLRAEENEAFTIFPFKQALDADIMHQLGKARELRWIGIADIRIEDQWLKELEGCTELEAFSLSRTGISDAGIAHISHLKKITNMTVLNTAVTGEAISRMACAPTVKTVMFGDQGADIGSGVHAVIHACDGMRELYVTGILKGTDLAGMERLPRLESVGFQHCRVTADMLEALAPGTWPRKLRLTGCQLDAAAWQSLKKLTDLHTLCLIMDEWPEDATSALLSLRSLQRLELMGNTRQFAPMLRQAIPNLSIMTDQ